ncbi:class I SAM-dependent methyltransferase [Aliarcobacter butzleri]|uniref:class I SAM-dependent methyltransferase n=1 Tax=Aliarcobacter butzleri TaxID=28197 RepID=UPI001EDB8EEF|nr:class I SAM-dependent methyltransferase [Aliarcobacter butzleri]MCG3675164.1 class I SAM-dependent methyltransferase [Aliarcobacter butzleri]MCG3683698.1 class I SAM-dependent methyltransferase [Aliarcobacter butzleri]MCG3697861.1 class I SAM-dependent methyltransferase [Aliarcobacter butzleri]MCG3699899.1 class I SAM-dependent methyltransferase [Aliarcobacter butzleri]MCT7620088.1 class I SAM-dependent methyltransferase [Aliarcobacter butzleri]
MFYTYNYFRQHNEDKEIVNHKEFYKKFSNEREFGGGFSHFDHLIKNRFMDIYGHMINIFLRKMPKDVLDIGCGAGINLPLSKYFDFVNYIGIDYAEKTLEHSRSIYPNIHFEVQDAFNLNLKKKFDLSIISSVLILYKEEKDRLKLLENAKNILKDDGLVVAIVWKDSWLLKYSIKLSRIIAKIRKIKLPEDFMGIHFTQKEATIMFEKANFKIEETIHTSHFYGALESVRYLNMKKYKRNFGIGEKEIGNEKKQNILEDLKKESGSNFLITFYYFMANYFPSSLSMFSIYVLSKK